MSIQVTGHEVMVRTAIVLFVDRLWCYATVFKYWRILLMRAGAPVAVRRLPESGADIFIVSSSV